MLFLLIAFSINAFCHSMENIPEHEFEQQLSAFKISTCWDDIPMDNLLMFESKIIEQKNLLNVLNDYIHLTQHLSNLSNKKSSTARFSGSYKEFEFRLKPTTIPYTREFEGLANPIYANAMNAIEKYNVLDVKYHLDESQEFIFKKFLVAQKKFAVHDSKLLALKIIHADIYFIVRLFNSYQTLDKFNITQEVKKYFIDLLKAHQIFYQSSHIINKIDIKSTSPIAEPFIKLLNDPHNNYSFLQAFILVSLKNTVTLDTKNVYLSNAIQL